MDGRLKILVADDSEAFRGSLIKSLRGAPLGIDVIEVDAYSDRFLAESISLFDCAFIDYHLPPSGGLHLVGITRDLDIKTPIVVCGTRSNDAVQAAALSAGATHYLDKASIASGALDGALHSLVAECRSQSRIFSLLSFVPFPVMEITSAGMVTFANGAMLEAIPEIAEIGTSTKALKNWHSIVSYLASGDHKYFVRRISIDSKEYLQYVAVSQEPSASQEPSLFSVYFLHLSRDAEAMVNAVDYDALTGLPNRKLFSDRLGRTLAREKRHRKQFFAVLMVDVDGFCVINELYGELHADHALQEIAGRLSACVRFEDTVARLDDDELGVLIESPRSFNDVIVIARRLLTSLRRPHAIDGKSVSITASIGIALSETGYSEPDHMLRDVAIATRQAKLAGGDRFAVFEPEAHVTGGVPDSCSAPAGRNELILRYEPIVSLDTGRLTGLRQRLQWLHREQDAADLESFLKDAEETGTLLEIERWAVNSAIDHASTWQASAPGSAVPSVWLSVSRTTLFSEELLRDLVSAAAGCEGADPPTRRLVLCIPAAAIQDDYCLDLAGGLFAELRSLGPRISVEGFGRGPLLLGSLRQLHIDFLSLDVGLIFEMATSENIDVARSITGLSRALGLELVATGIERRAHLDAATSVGCDYAQGQRFGLPVPVEKATEMIVNERRWAVGSEAATCRPQK